MDRELSREKQMSEHVDQAVEEPANAFREMGED